VGIAETVGLFEVSTFLSVLARNHEIPQTVVVVPGSVRIGLK
jgi:hypothetical protein